MDLERLRQQVAEEKRLIRIYEASLDLALSRSKEHMLVEEEDDDDDDDDDWLETLDALQSKTTTTAGTAPWQFDSKWHDDPLLQRLMPSVCGIRFTDARLLSAATNNNNNNNINSVTNNARTYRLEATILPRRKNNNNNTDSSCGLRCVVVMRVVLGVPKDDDEDEENTRIPEPASSTGGGGGAAVVDRVGVDFFRNDSVAFSCPELARIARVARDHCNLPLLFRQLLSWMDLDDRRNQLLKEYHPRLERWSLEEPHRIRVRPMTHHHHDHHHHQQQEQDTPLVVLVYQWCVDWQTAGHEELRFESLNQDELLLTQDTIATILNQQYMEDLVASLQGSKEKALRMILTVFFPES